MFIVEWTKFTDSNVHLLAFQGIELNEDMQSLIKNRLLIILMVLEVVQYSLLIGGIVAFVVFGIWYLIRRNKDTKIIPIS